MDMDFENIISILDKKVFDAASPEMRKQSLISLCYYFAKVRHTDIDVEFIEMKEGWVGYVDRKSIKLSNTIDLNNYMKYLSMFDTVIHESFHIFQNYLCTLPKSMVDDVLWQRIKVYKQYDLFHLINFEEDNDDYFLNYCELDTYRYTDFMMHKIYKILKSKGKDVDGIYQYNKFEREVFLSRTKKIKKSLGDGAVRIINGRIERLAWIKFLADQNSPQAKRYKGPKKLKERFNDGEYGDNIEEGVSSYTITDEFIKTAQLNFREALPHLYANIENEQEKN